LLSRGRCRQLTPERGNEPLWIPEQSQSIVDRRHHHIRRRQCARGQSLSSDDGDAELCLAEHVRVIRSVADRDHALGTQLLMTSAFCAVSGRPTCSRLARTPRCGAMLSRRPNVSAETSCTAPDDVDGKDVVRDEPLARPTSWSLAFWPALSP
jgi:hypothetical protein